MTDHEVPIMSKDRPETVQRLCMSRDRPENVHDHEVLIMSRDRPETVQRRLSSEPSKQQSLHSLKWIKTEG